MKAIFTAATITVIITLVSCKETVTKRKYLIVTETVRPNVFGEGFEKTKRVDTVEAESDSAAYWEGVYQYTAELRTTKMLKDDSHKEALTKPLAFDVVNHEGRSILTLIPASEKEKAKDFVVLKVQ